MSTKVGRLDFRVEIEDKDTIEKATLLSGQTVSGFAKSVLSHAARRVIANHQETFLSQQNLFGCGQQRRRTWGLCGRGGCSQRECSFLR